jgi:hypothetical protein
MAGLKVSVSVMSNRLPALAAAYPQRAGREVRTALFNIEAGCKQRSRVDTGAMRAGWQSQMTGPAEGEVSNPVEHTVYNEYGTVNMPAQPMAHPAADAEQGPFQARIAKALGEV